MALFTWQKKQREDGREELELSQEDQERIDKAARAAERLPEIEQRLSKLDSIEEFINMYKSEKAEESRKRQQQQQQQQQQVEDEGFEELMLTDPKKAVSMALQPTQQALLTLRADNMRREIFEDANNFKYYHGTIKREVDNLLSAQPLAARNDPSVIENAYHTVVGKHNDEILEGKLKNRFAASEASSRSTGAGNAGDTGAGDKKKVVIDDDIRKIAKGLGFKPEEYAKMLEEEGIGYV